MPDHGRCYVETHDESYIGHFPLRLTEFSRTHLAFEIVRELTWARTKDARIISRQFADKMRLFATILYRASQRLPNPVTLRFARGGECGVFWLQLAVAANIVQRIDYAAR